MTVKIYRYFTFFLGTLDKLLSTPVTCINMTTTLPVLSCFHVTAFMGFFVACSISVSTGGKPQSL